MAAVIPEVETSTKVSKKVTDNEGNVATCEATTSKVSEEKPVEYKDCRSSDNSIKDPEKYDVLYIRRTGEKIYIPKNLNNPAWLRKCGIKRTRPRRTGGEAQLRQQPDSETGGK